MDGLLDPVTQLHRLPYSWILIIHDMQVRQATTQPRRQ
jgi:hypothetical protein